MSRSANNVKQHRVAKPRIYIVLAHDEGTITTWCGFETVEKAQAKVIEWKQLAISDHWDWIRKRSAKDYLRVAPIHIIIGSNAFAAQACVQLESLLQRKLSVSSVVVDDELHLTPEDFRDALASGFSFTSIASKLTVWTKNSGSYRDIPSGIPLALDQLSTYDAVSTHSLYFLNALPAEMKASVERFCTAEIQELQSWQILPCEIE